MEPSFVWAVSRELFRSTKTILFSFQGRNGAKDVERFDGHSRQGRRPRVPGSQRSDSASHRVRQRIPLRRRVSSRQPRFDGSHRRRPVAADPRSGLLGPPRSRGTVGPERSRCQRLHAQRRNPVRHLRGPGNQGSPDPAEGAAAASRTSEGSTFEVCVDEDSVDPTNVAARKDEHDEERCSGRKTLLHSKFRHKLKAGKIVFCVVAVA